MGEFIRSMDWSATPLGRRVDWPQTLSIATNLILGSTFPMAILWGKELIFVYNDAYRVIAGEKHPDAMGRSAREVWPEAWEFNRPLFERVMLRGETVHLEDQLFRIPRRGGHPEDDYFMLCYSPIRTENGQVGGTLVTLIETTQRILAKETLRKAKYELEKEVQRRTAELQRTNEELKEENQRRIRTEESLRLEEARLDALLHLSQISEAPLKEITAFALEQAIGLTHSKIGFVGFLNEDESIYTLHAVSRDVVKECRVTGEPLQWHVVDAGIWAEAIRERKTLFVNDYRKPHPQKKGLPPGHPDVERLMVVPILRSGKVVAVAGVANKASDYDKSDERQILLLLNGMWGYMQKNRSREELKKAYGELEEKVTRRTAELAASAAVLQEREKDLNRAQEVGQIGSWRLDIRRDVLAWSDENYRIFGVASGTPMTYETFLEIVHPDDRRYVDTKWQAALRGEPYDIEHRILVEGRSKWVREKAYLEFDGSGSLLGGFGITQDITGRKEMEEELRKSRDELELRVQERTKQLKRQAELLDLTHDAIIVRELEGAVTFWNKGAQEMYGWTKEEAKGKIMRNLLQTQFPIPRDEIMTKLMQDGRWEGELTHTRKDGKKIKTLCRWTLQRDEEGKPAGVMIISHDITERLRLEEQLRQAQKMDALGTLAGGIAHDFNNLLQPILINTELALLDIQEGKLPSPQSLQVVREATKRGQELVKQIITFSRQKDQVRKPVEISPIIKEALRFLRATLPSSIEIRERMEAASVVVLADPTQIYQVLMNLCSNAAHAMRDRGGTLEVSLARVEMRGDLPVFQGGLKPGPYLRLTVKDNGHGMSREVRERAFDPFFTMKKPGEGTGMGLAMVHGIVQKHEGAITLESEVEKGTTVSVFLPLVQEGQEEELSVLGPILKGKERILLVDDEKSLVSSAKSMLERLGYRVMGKTDAREAMEVFRSKPNSFDLVITDQTMPHLTGEKLACELLNIRPDIPIILCTGFSETVDEEGARAIGVRDFVMKPFALREMANVIRRALARMPWSGASSFGSKAEG